VPCGQVALARSAIWPSWAHPGRHGRGARGLSGATPMCAEGQVALARSATWPLKPPPAALCVRAACAAHGSPRLCSSPLAYHRIQDVDVDVESFPARASAPASGFQVRVRTATGHDVCSSSTRRRIRVQHWCASRSRAAADPAARDARGLSLDPPLGAGHRLVGTPRPLPAQSSPAAQAVSVRSAACCGPLRRRPAGAARPQHAETLLRARGPRQAVDPG
jgi:hypothetical protein